MQLNKSNHNKGNYILMQNDSIVEQFQITDHIYTLCKDFIDLTRTIMDTQDIVLDVTEYFVPTIITY